MKHKDDIEKSLFELRDLKYRNFSLMLIPGVQPDSVIGVRIPALRKFAAALSRTPEAAEFLTRLPHRYHEENNLHAFLIERMDDFGECTEALNAFLPYVNNWSTCDSCCPKIFKKHTPELLEQIRLWTASEHTYTVRFGLEMLMRFYLDEGFSTEYLELAAGVSSGEYYVNMMLAWFFATALAKQYSRTLPYIENRRLERWVHNKTIQKAVESFRVSGEQKEYLKTLKIR